MMASRYPARGQRLAELGHIKAQSLLVSSTETTHPQTSNITEEHVAEPSDRFTEPSTSDDDISVTEVKETSSTLQITTSAGDHTNRSNTLVTSFFMIFIPRIIDQLNIALAVSNIQMYILGTKLDNWHPDYSIKYTNGHMTFVQTPS